MKRNILPTVPSWHRLDEHFRRLKVDATALETAIEELETRTAELEDIPTSAYKVRSSILKRTGLNVFTEVVLENTLGIDIVWNGAGGGFITGTSVSPVFLDNKTAILNGGLPFTNYNIAGIRQFNTEVVITFRQDAGIVDPNFADGMFIEIRVYN